MTTKLNEKETKFASFRKKFRSILHILLVWGKPFVKDAIVNELAPKIKETLKDKIGEHVGNSKVINDLIEAGVNKAISEFNERI